MQKENYYQRHRLELCKKQLEQYMPKSMKEIQSQIPEQVHAYYEKYPYEIYGEPLIRKKLRYEGIRESALEYQECYSAAMQAYLYSIHRCAFCGYSHTEFYIRKMIHLAVIWGIVIASEGKYMVRLDDNRNQRRY